MSGFSKFLASGILVAMLGSVSLPQTLAQSPQDQAIFRSGTRLVEVDVVIRDKNGPVRGLTKDDFLLWDCTASERNLNVTRTEPCRVKRQPIAVFREMTEQAALQASKPSVPLGPGAVSNRTSNDGQEINSATVVVFDQVNTPFNLKAYQRTQIETLFKSIGDHNNIAVYALGSQLRILQDFTNDQKKLIEAAAKIDPGQRFNITPMSGDTLDFARLQQQVAADMKRDIVVDAVKKIIRHMEGLPGRKNLVWVAQDLSVFDPHPLIGRPIVPILLGQANIAVYPVTVRLLATGNITGAKMRGGPHATGDLIHREANENIAEAIGGQNFDDAAYAIDGVRAAERDAKDYYVLGFYPEEKDLDNGTHQLTVDLAKSAHGRGDLTMQYRTVYFASKSGIVGPEEKPTLTDLFASPLDQTAIGLAANIVADRTNAAARQLQLSVNLHDIQLHHENGRSQGSFQVAIRYETKEAGETVTTQTSIVPVPVNFTDAELPEYGLVTLLVPAGLKSGATAHIVVLDAANGAAGSLRVLVAR